MPLPKMNRYVLRLQDGSRVKVRAQRPPTWAAVATRMMPQYRYTGKTMAGLGRFMEVDRSLPLVPERSIATFEMRRHAKEATTNERWIQRLLRSEFCYSDLDARQVMRVEECELIESRWQQVLAAEAVAYTRREVERAQQRVQQGLPAPL